MQWLVTKAYDPDVVERKSYIMQDMIVYHYCDNKALEGIIKNKQLWMTDISNSNDYNEVLLFNPRLFYAIEEIYVKNPFNIDFRGKQNNLAIKDLLSLISGCTNQFYANGYLTSFVSCFCEKGDILSQWRGYANDGKGCSVGFSRNEIQKYCDSTNGMIFFNRVVYVNKQELDEIILNEAKHICDIVRNKKYDNDALLFLDMNNLIEKTLLNSLVYKMNGFQEELEWRIYFGKSIKSTDFKSDELNRGDEYVINQTCQDYLNKLDFIVKDDSITPYFPFDLKELSDNPIKRVYLGPKSRVKDTDLQMMLAKNGIKGVKVFQSGISYC